MGLRYFWLCEGFNFLVVAGTESYYEKCCRDEKDRKKVEKFVPVQRPFANNVKPNVYGGSKKYWGDARYCHDGENEFGTNRAFRGVSKEEIYDNEIESHKNKSQKIFK